MATNTADTAGKADIVEQAERPKAKFFEHIPHPHPQRNVNLIHETEIAAGGMNQKVAMTLTNIFQAMPTFWLIMLWFVFWIGANLTILNFDPLPWPLLLTLASIPQLPLMIVIMVGQGLLGRKQELQSEEQFRTTENSYHDIEQIIQHLSSQDEELLKQTKMLIDLVQKAQVASGRQDSTQEEGAKMK